MKYKERNLDKIFEIFGMFKKEEERKSRGTKREETEREIE